MAPGLPTLRVTTPRHELKSIKSVGGLEQSSEGAAESFEGSLCSYSSPH